MRGDGPWLLATTRTTEAMRQVMHGLRSTTRSHTIQWRFTRPKPVDRQIEPVDADGMFGLLVIAGVLLVLGALALLPVALMLPAVSLAALAAAAVTAGIAWRIGAERHAPRMTAWDVAGAFALIGFGAGMISDPAHVLQLFGLTTPP